MVKKHLFLLLALVATFTFATSAKAQMSDDAVIDYVENGLSIGKSQDVLMKELALKGVTKEQAERLKKQYENKQQNVGVAEGQAQRTHLSLYGEGAQSNVFSFEMLSEKIVEYSAQQVFGRNIFSYNMLTFEPNENLATPENYKLGPGDEVIIDVWGTNQTTIRRTISPDGFINIDGVGLAYLGGMTIKEADEYMRRKLGRIYSVEGEGAQSEIKLTLGAIRTITVNVMGEVAVPGTYSLSSLSSVYNALYRAGGFSDLGSVRSVHLVRNNKKIAEIDVYDFIVNGKTADNATLQDGDVILVPAYEAIVSVAGHVKRPMRYEVRKGESVSDVIAYAGGFKGEAYTANINVERRNGREYQVYTVDNSDYSAFQLVDGDSLWVGEIVNRYENRVEIKGAVYRPGVYQLSDKVNTVSKLIAVADGLRGDAFVNRALLHRECEDRTLELISVDLKGILDGSVEDIELRKNDVLTISNANELNVLGGVKVVGEVAKPGVYRFAKNTTLEDIILQAGGLRESASTAKVDVSRRVKNPQGMEDVDTITQMFTFSIDGEYNIQGGDVFVLEPYDQVYVRKSPGYSAQHHVRVEGEVLFPGSYALARKSMRLSDVVNMSGGVSSLAYIKGAKLERRMTDVERQQFEAALDMVENVRGEVNVEKLDSARTYSVGIDLVEALSNPGSDADIVLREGDVIIVPEYVNTVKISGCVLYPNTVTYSPKKTVGDYITQAGGYGFGSKKNRAYVVYSNGMVGKARKNSREVVEPGCEIIVPEKKKREGGLQNILSVASTTASLATMFATIYNIIK